MKLIQVYISGRRGRNWMHRMDLICRCLMQLLSLIIQSLVLRHPCRDTGEDYRFRNISETMVILPPTQISGNIFVALKGHMKGSHCRTYGSGMKVRIDETKFLYPDLFVTCEASNEESNYAKRSPELIVEVLSPATEAYDRDQNR